MEEETVFDTVQLQEILMHRYPFLLVDKIVEFIDNERIVGVKNVTINEPFFQGHFPGRPVMPGVLIVESMAQTSAVLALRSTEGTGPNKAMLLVGAQDLRWKKMVVPGDTLRIEVDFIKRKGPLWIVTAQAKVGDQLAASGTLSAIIAD